MESLVDYIYRMLAENMEIIESNNLKLTIEGILNYSPYYYQQIDFTNLSLKEKRTIINDLYKDREKIESFI